MCCKAIYIKPCRTVSRSANGIDRQKCLALKTIGKTFKFKTGDEFEFTISALIKDLPANTHLKASVLLSHSYQENFLKTQSGWLDICIGHRNFYYNSRAKPIPVYWWRSSKPLLTNTSTPKPAVVSKRFCLCNPLSEVHFATDVSDMKGHIIELVVVLWADWFWPCWCWPA